MRVYLDNCCYNRPFEAGKCLDGNAYRKSDDFHFGDGKCR